MQPLEFRSEEELLQRRTDLDLWAPYVRRVCRLHRLEAGAIRAGSSLAHPVFVVGERYAVKVHGPYGEALRHHLVEREVCALFRGSSLPLPGLVARGELAPGTSRWPWPYLVTRALPGRLYGAVEEQLDLEARLEVARFAGRILARLHRSPLSGPVLGHSRDHFLEFLAGRLQAWPGDHARWGSLPLHLGRQVAGFLPPLRDLIGPQGLRLLHTALDRGHLLVEERAGRWAGAGVIDFGRARAGEPLYELGPLHLGLFRADKRLLAACLEGYGLEPALGSGEARRALALALLHEQDVLGPVFAEFPALALTPTLEELASRLFDLGVVGLRGERGR